MISNRILLYCLFAVFFLCGCRKDEDITTPVNNIPVESGITIVKPLNNSTINTFTPLMEWEQYLNSSSYIIQISLDANFLSPLLLDSNISATQTTPPDGRITTNIYYYWRVKADLGNGNYSNWSNVFRFKVILTPPLPPDLQQPANNSVNQSFLPLFIWNQSMTAQNYRLQVSSNQAFSSILLDTGNIILTSLQCPYFYLSTNSDYYWRVNASNSNGVSIGNWSQVFTFRTINGPLPNTISGTVKFFDNNFVQPPGYYVIAAFRPNRWPPGQLIPDYSSQLSIQYVNNEYIANYIFRNIQNGDYHIAVFATSRSVSVDNIYKSVYGCDTSRVLYNNCPLINPATVTISNGNGMIDINMLSWADSSKSIF